MAQGCGGLTMKVIDKRAEKNEDWNVGDVICYWNDNHSDNKGYGTIIYDPIHDKFRFLIMKRMDLSLLETATPVFLQDELKKEFDHIEKVNAHLVVED